MTVSIHILLNGHVAIMRSARLLLAMVTVGGPPVLRAYGRLASLAATVAAHEAHERDFVYVPPGHAGDRTAAARFATEHAVLHRDWVAYLQAWPNHRIVGETDDFRHETRAILQRVLDRIARENSVLHPHALADRCLRPI